MISKTVLIFSFIITFVIFNDISADKILKFYEEIGCKQVNVSGLWRFDCPDYSKLSNNKCLFQGKEFNLRQIIEGDAALPPCDRHRCRCVHRLYEKAYIDCTLIQDGCLEHWEIPPDWSCLQTYELDKCCLKDEICGRAIEELSTCVVDGHSYRAGQRIAPKDDCFECVCADGYNNETSLAENEHCVRKKCGFGLNLQELRDGCVPIFYPGRCCPYNWYKCPQKNDTIDTSSVIFATNENENHTCSFGALLLKIGETLKTEESCLNCHCSTPPFITCTRWGDC